MSQIISDFYYEHDGFLSWYFNGEIIQLKFTHKIFAMPLKDMTGIILIKHSKEVSPNNAFIINADGTERVTINNPFNYSKSTSFVDAFYESDDLKLTLYDNGLFYACVIDELGNVLETYETR